MTRVFVFVVVVVAVAALVAVAVWQQRIAAMAASGILVTIMIAVAAGGGGVEVHWRGLGFQCCLLLCLVLWLLHPHQRIRSEIFPKHSLSQRSGPNVLYIWESARE